MRNSSFLTYREIKRTGAKALREIKQKLGFSNYGLADLLGNCEGTIRKRLDEDSENHQITVAELLKSLEARDLLALVGYHPAPNHPETVQDVFDVIDDGHSFVGETIHAHRTGTGIDPEQARNLLPKSVALRERLRAFENMLREIVDHARD